MSELPVDVRYPPPHGGDGRGPGDQRDGPDADGPPPPPFVRERQARRRRRRWIAIGAVAVVLLFLGVPLLAGGAFQLYDRSDEATDAPADDPAPTDPDGPPDDDDAADGSPGDEDDDPTDGEELGGDPDTGDDGRTSGEDPGERPDREVPADERIAAPNLEGLDADDTRLAELLLDIDASERVMLGYQLDVREAFRGDLDLDDPEELLSAVRAAARTGLDDLEVLRDRLATPQPDPAAEGVRESYVEHLDTWLTYLSAIDDDPQIMLGDLTRYTVHINRTGDTFVRAVDELLSTDVDAGLSDYAQQVVDRGFSGPERPQA